MNIPAFRKAMHVFVHGPHALDVTEWAADWVFGQMRSYPRRWGPGTLRNEDHNCIDFVYEFVCRLNGGQCPPEEGWPEPFRRLDARSVAEMGGARTSVFMTPGFPPNRYVWRKQRNKQKHTWNLCVVKMCCLLLEKKQFFHIFYLHVEISTHNVTFCESVLCKRARQTNVPFFFCFLVSQKFYPFHFFVNDNFRFGHTFHAQFMCYTKKKWSSAVRALRIAGIFFSTGDEKIRLFGRHHWCAMCYLSSWLPLCPIIYLPQIRPAFPLVIGMLVFRLPGKSAQQHALCDMFVCLFGIDTCFYFKCRLPMPAINLLERAISPTHIRTIFSRRPPQQKFPALRWRQYI